MKDGTFHDTERSKCEEPSKKTREGTRVRDKMSQEICFLRLPPPSLLTCRFLPSVDRHFQHHGSRRQLMPRSAREASATFHDCIAPYQSRKLMLLKLWIERSQRVCQSSHQGVNAGQSRKECSTVWRLGRDGGEGERPVQKRGSRLSACFL